MSLVIKWLAIGPSDRGGLWSMSFLEDERAGNASDDLYHLYHLCSDEEPMKLIATQGTAKKKFKGAMERDTVRQYPVIYKRMHYTCNHDIISLYTSCSACASISLSLTIVLLRCPITLS